MRRSVVNRAARISSLWLRNTVRETRPLSYRAYTSEWLHSRLHVRRRGGRGIKCCALGDAQELSSLREQLKLAILVLLHGGMLCHLGIASMLTSQLFLTPVTLLAAGGL
jgi:hypothetical protein